MLNKKNIISTMIDQHRLLQKEVKSISDILTNDSVDTITVNIILSEFKKNLEIHLTLENNVFYVELFKEMESKGQNTSDTKDFIDQMKDIEKIVIGFLEKYNSSDSVKNNIVDFKKEFVSIRETLTLRIESGEEGVYTYWQ